MESVLNVLTSVAVLAVVAVGLYIIFGLMQVINMAHGDMLMLGAYSTFVLTQAGLNFWVAAAAATVIVGIIGGLIELGVVRFLYQSGNLSTMLATWGVSIVLQQIVKLIFGPQGQFVDVPMSSMVSVFGTEYPAYRVMILLICVFILAAIFLILKKTRAGLLVRATMDRTDMAEAMGINTKRVYSFGFVAGSALAGLAGALVSPIASISPLMGLDYVTKSFLVVMVGGTESMFSTIGGAAIIGGLQNILNYFMDATKSWMIVLIIVIVAIWIRPQGVFSKK
jgi:urea transport system permease protein